MSIDTKAIEKHIRGILIALGDDPDREGLKETPKRVAKMYEEVFKGMEYSNDDIAEMFNKTFEEDLKESEEDNIVLVKDIEIFSHCEHHLTLMYNMTVAVAYIPNKRLIGLSKIARIADMVSRRLQLQERIGKDIAEIMEKVTASKDIAVIIKGEHGCMTSRGIKKPGALTTTMTLKGRFKNDDSLVTKLMALYKA
ncbi:GTP cyclohydrolase I [Clostridium acetobutylicum]|uniref:GTP cyclohydrolase 1 n=1 Tax=Clostridium acetobutylicum (strain ATCC 824 / DSM 792 / JCM 1419 / IAM 19013 / LMG 5710 / NBRC 13948 / NRRL B-527 / VKM B-1787 / 2291 / W) TaxID=272562 RepID=GCH1_CLOAB|nr:MULTISPECIES: GTP cyclohydrolase I FolE [Clostridium]Q97D54.1 RecName: Full=GTP cyclohydrolase 1; AltName: Full=GTP cyclohydrolase I; Short=GTP-CH-I [Clostridium acetobutylicum ATCC 824]AAK81549.1 GTP cyclohydrolase I [Clostridium acetobutylicum ATCC 824]ADZ22670.1 GTP cyclohydrolase I [Clostridium acetobutylicum EA 2018]AEI33064.1 GTP cyclohydrolase I [Clostridium acetobutylicum DSM 1731]AWV80778.1 GTP cyclohydrolase I FolE [Clostridium acetobutylicum]MBC2393897.1 GTP cyclohydrolase I Fol